MLQAVYFPGIMSIISNGLKFLPVFRNAKKREGNAKRGNIKTGFTSRYGAKIILCHFQGQVVMDVTIDTGHEFNLIVFFCNSPPFIPQLAL